MNLDCFKTISTHCKLSLQKILQPMVHLGCSRNNFNPFWIESSENISTIVNLVCLRNNCNALVAQSQWPPSVWQRRFKATIWFPPFINPQFYLQLLYNSNLPFTLKFESKSISLFWPKKVKLKAKINIFLTFSAGSLKNFIFFSIRYFKSYPQK